MNKAAFLGALTLGLALAGCSSLGGEDKFSASFVRAHLIEGKTTQAEVKAIYGVPDDQDVHSGGADTWIYSKDGLLDTVASVVNYVPGASSVSSAINTKKQVDGASSTVNKAINKGSGKTEHNGRTLYIYFDSRKIVRSWLL